MHRNGPAAHSSKTLPVYINRWRWCLYNVCAVDSSDEILENICLCKLHFHVGQLISSSYQNTSRFVLTGASTENPLLLSPVHCRLSYHCSISLTVVRLQLPWCIWVHPTFHVLSVKLVPCLQQFARKLQYIWCNAWFIATTNLFRRFVQEGYGPEQSYWIALRHITDTQLIRNFHRYHPN